MEIITVDINNIDREHICCAIASKKGDNRAESKKGWLKERFADGLVFKKLNTRGKAFIEYIPAEKAFAPIVAPNYMYVNCFWVSGKLKGNGYANQLLEECISDAKEKGKAGLVVLSSTKKKPFLSDPRFLKYKGFKICDTTKPYYELLHFPFNETFDAPFIKDCAKAGTTSEQGVVVYYTHQCPHTAMYIKVIEEVAKQKNVKFKTIQLYDTESAQSAPNPFTTYSIYFNGVFETNEILTAKKFTKLLSEKGLI